MISVTGLTTAKAFIWIMRYLHLKKLTMHIQYLSKETYNGPSKEIGNRLLYKATEQFREEYMYLSKNQLLDLLVDKVESLLHGIEINRLRDKIEKLNADKVARLEEELGKRADFFNRNKKTAIIVPFSTLRKEK